MVYMNVHSTDADPLSHLEFLEADELILGIEALDEFEADALTNQYGWFDPTCH